MVSTPVALLKNVYIKVNIKEDGINNICMSIYLVITVLLLFILFFFILTQYFAHKRVHNHPNSTTTFRKHPSPS